ncbi:MAG: 23S rRNA (guanosine(2251)-2'-O)-methyltransferase RlmB [Coxiellaceae bacterium]|nr:MAG: 23S rRNA (guanosine(2251)-2'-O)-methyltransferase RlmB [Coxiellaceae bacterium]
MLEKQNGSLIYGLHAVKAALQQTTTSITKLYLLQDKVAHEFAAIEKQARKQQIQIIYSSREQLDQLLPNAKHQGIIAICQTDKEYFESDLPALIEAVSGPAFLLILDGVQDPHNLGACLRTASAAGVHAVIAPKDRAVGITPTVRKVASGAAEFVPFIPVTNLARTMRWLKEQGIWLYGATEEGSNNLYQADLSGPIAIVLGAEGAGMRQLTKQHCDVLFYIPTSGAIGTLNVSVATGVCLFEALRQRLK